jgi:predicted membrane protein (TIGR00267 family)
MADPARAEGNLLLRLLRRIIGKERSKKVDEALRMPETIPSMRRYFVNTIFDSTFVVLGVIIGSAFSPDPSMRIVIATILTSSVALSISTGVSVYEAEFMEQSIRINEIEKAMLRKLDHTSIERTSKVSVILISVVNSSAPLMACGLALMPFLLLPEGDIQIAAWIAVGLALTLLFITGVIMGRIGKRNPAFYGLRMAGAGVMAFIVGFLIEGLV